MGRAKRLSEVGKLEAGAGSGEVLPEDLIGGSLDVAESEEAIEAEEFNGLSLAGLLRARGVDLSSLKSEKRLTLKWREMDEVVDVSMDWLMDVTRVGVVYDVDVDGLVAGKIIEDTMKRKGYMVYRFMNTRKKHGITRDVIEFVKRERIELLYVVDAGTNDVVAHQELSDMGVKLIVLDHHEQTDVAKIKNVYVVNCSVYEELPKLSGGGVCYRYVELLNRRTGGTDVTHYEPWVGLTVLSDHCSMLDAENRYYVDTLYANYDQVDLFNAFDFYGSKRNLFLFGVIPFLNACIRTNNGDYAMEAMHMGGVKEIKKFVKEKRAYVLDLQKSMLDEMFEKAKMRTGKHLVVLRLSNEHIAWSGMTGLLANKVMNDAKKSVVVTYVENDKFLGSFRGMGAMTNRVLEGVGWRVMGHPHAAGIEVPVERAPELFEAGLSVELGKPKESFDFELHDYDVVRNLDFLSKLARFNEMTGGDIETLKFKLVTGRTPFKNVWGKKVEYDFQSFRVRDFREARSMSDEWVIEPLLDRNGIVLLRD